MELWRRYGRSIVQVIAAGGVVAMAALTGDQRIDPSEWINVVLAVLSAAAVFTLPNVPGAPYIKTTIAVLTAVTMAATALIADGISWTDAGQLLLAALAALGVKLAPSISTLPASASAADGAPPFRYSGGSGPAGG
jgi:hypothetical protein